MAILDDGLQRLRELLRETGAVPEEELVAVPSSGGAVMPLASLNRRILIHATTAAYPKDIDALVHRRLPSQDSVLLLIVRRISRPSFERCRQSGLCVLDLEGSAYLKLPGVYVERYTESKPQARPRVAGTVFTAASSRIVRALLADPRRVWTQPELAWATQISAGYVSTRVRLLLEQGYVRSRAGAISLADPGRLLDDWGTFYRFDRHRQHRFALSMANYEQGIGKLTAELRRCGVAFAYTGWTGAFLRSPYGIPTVLMAYVDRLPPSDDTKTLHPVQSEANLVLLLPHDEGVFQFTQDCGDQGWVVSDAQLYVDLMKMPGRAREQADALRQQRLDYSEVRAAR